jgi:hypothetical protein
MTENHAPREKKLPDTVGKDKKLYRKPSFRYERVFEIQALSCGKLVGTGAQCQHVKKHS